MSTRGGYRRRFYPRRGGRSRSRRFMVGRQRSLWQWESGRWDAPTGSAANDWEVITAVDAADIEIVKVHHMRVLLSPVDTIPSSGADLHVGRGRFGLLNLTGFENDQRNSITSELNQANNPTLHRLYATQPLMLNSKSFPVYEIHVPGAKVLQRGQAIVMCFKEDNNMGGIQYIFSARVEPVDVRNAV